MKNTHNIIKYFYRSLFPETHKGNKYYDLVIKENFATPSSSFVELKDINNEKAYQALMKYFKNQQMGTPFFLIPSNAVELPSKILKSTLKHGFKKENTVTYNIWNKVTDFNLPKKYTFCYGNYFEPTIFNDYKILTMKNFAGLNETFFKMMKKFLISNKENVRTIILYYNKRPIGTASFLITEKNCLLFGATINKRHRQKGLWKCLVGLRQLLSLEFNIDYWILATSNDIIRKKADYFQDYHVMRFDK